MYREGVIYMATDRAPSVFGAWYQEQLRAAGKTQVQIARECGINKVSLSKIMTGVTKKPEEDTVICLAQAVGADVNEALLRAGHAPRDAMEARTEIQREALQIIDSVPPNKQPAVIKALRSLADAVSAA